MDLREAKALEIAARLRLTYKDDAWRVPSQSGNGSYRVTVFAIDGYRHRAATRTLLRFR